MADDNYPKYYNVDDVPVKLILDGDIVVGKLANGLDYPIGKAIVDGYRISKNAYLKLARKLYGEEGSKNA